MMKKQVVLLSLLLLHGSQSNMVLETDLQQRHSVPPTDKRAVFNFPIVVTNGGSASHFLATSNSNNNNHLHEVCTPELDGYFGGGTGRPPMAQLHVVQADRMDIFDTLLVTTFPHVCHDDHHDVQRSIVRPLQGRVSGYHFGATEQWCTNSTKQTTTPQQHHPDGCTTVTTVSLYGHDITWDDCVTLLDTLTQYIPSAHRYASRIEHVGSPLLRKTSVVHTVLVVLTVLLVTIALAVVWRWSSSSSNSAKSGDDRTVRTHVTSIYLHDEEEESLTEQSSRRSYHSRDELRSMPRSSMRRESRGW